MSTIRAEANVNDIGMANTWTSIGSTRNGTGIFSNSGVSATEWFSSMGQAKGGPGLVSTDFQTCEAFFRFTTTWPSSVDKLVSAWLDVRLSFFGGSVTRQIEYREHDFGGAPDPGTGGPNSPTKGDWVNTGGPAPGPLSDLDLLATVPGINSSTGLAFRPYLASGPGLYERVLTGVALDVIGTTDRQRTLIAPGSDERIGVIFSNYADDNYRPNLHISTIADSTLLRQGGAAAQLSDGTSVFVDGYTLKHSVDNVADDDIATLVTGTGSGQFDDDTVGWQTLSMAVDASDNIWLVGKGGAGASALCIAAFVKGSGYSWTAQPVRQVTAPAYGSNADTPVNNVAIAWHPTANLGSLMVMLSHRAGSGDTGQLAWMTISCNNVIAGVSSVTASGINPGWLGITTHNDDGQRFANDTGNGLDVHADGLKGYAITWDGTSDTAYYNPQIRAGRYLLNSSGTIIGLTPWDEDDTPIELEPETKAKVVLCDSGRIAMCYGDRIHVFDDFGTRIVEGSPGMPELYEQTTDWLYDRATNQIWLYYFPAATPRTLVRRAFSLTTGAFGAPVTISATVGADGTNPALRLPRGVSNERTVRLEVGHRSAAGVLSTLVLNDTLNVAPNAPVLVDRQTFNADNPATFTWMFADANTDDAQSAFELEIRRTSDDVLIHDTGKTASGTSSYVLPAATLSNDTAYYWQVRVWDLADAVSAFSTTDAFNTVSTAITTITQPAEDNPADAQGSTYTVTWETTVIVQASYRLRLINTQTAQTVLDTGFVTSTDTSRTLNGLQDGITYRVEVTVRNNVAVESITGTRLITPDYIEPRQPVLVVTPGDTYLLVSVTNPPESGNEPVTLTNPGFETNTTGWVGNSATIARVTSQQHSGAAAVQVTPNGSSEQVSIDQTSADSAAPLGAVGTEYVFSVWVKSVAGYDQVSASILWRNSTPATIATVNGTPVAIPANEWTQVEVTGTVPAGAVAALLRVRMNSTPAVGDLLFVDDADFRTPGGGEPTVLFNELYRSPTDENDWTRIGLLANSGSYRDYAVASGKSYDYYVEAVV